MTTIQKAIEIFKNELPGAKGKFRPCVAENSNNIVEFYNEEGFYCSINIKTGRIKGV